MELQQGTVSIEFELQVSEIGPCMWYVFILGCGYVKNLN